MAKNKNILKAPGMCPESRVRESARSIGMDSIFRAWFRNPEYNSFEIGRIEWTGDDAKDLLEYGKTILSQYELPDYMSKFEAVRIFQGRLYADMVRYREESGFKAEGEEGTEDDNQ